MEFKPLTKEQYQSAIKSGFSPDQIIANEKKRKNEFTSTPVKQKETALEKVANFTGGKEMAQGLGQSIGIRRSLPGIEDSIDTQNEQITELTKLIREKRSRGEDTSRLIEQMQGLAESTQQTSQNISGMVEKLPTNREIAGSALQLAGTAVGGGVVGKGATGLTRGLNQAKQGVKQIVGGSAIGGGATSAGQAISDDKSIGGVVGSTIGGAALGAGLGYGGAKLGQAITKGIAKKGQGLPNLRKDILSKEASELVYPKPNTLKKADRINAIEQGRLIEPGLIRRGSVAPSARDQEIAESVAGIVRKKNSTAMNIGNITDEIAKKAQEVDQLLDEKTIKPVTRDLLDDRLVALKDESDFIFAGETSQENAYDSVVNLFQKEFEDAGGNVLQARRNFDARVNRSFPTLLEKIGKGEIGDRARSQAVMDVRRLANDLAEESLEEGNPLKQLLRQQSNMYRARNNISKNALEKLTKSQLEKFFRSPAGKVASAIGYTVGGALLANKALSAVNN